MCRDELYSLTFYRGLTFEEEQKRTGEILTTCNSMNASLGSLVGATNGLSAQITHLTPTFESTSNLSSIAASPPASLSSIPEDTSLLSTGSMAALITTGYNLGANGLREKYHNTKTLRRLRDIRELLDASPCTLRTEKRQASKIFGILDG